MGRAGRAGASLNEVLSIQVRCFAGHRGEETPRSFSLGTKTTHINEILDRWYGPDHRYFRVSSPAGDLYILRHDEATGRWEMTWFERAGGTPR